MTKHELEQNDITALQDAGIYLWGFTDDFDPELMPITEYEDEKILH